MISEKSQKRRYAAGDYLSTLAAVLIFNVARYHLLPSAQSCPTLVDYLLSHGTLMGEIFFPLMMMGIYALSGDYRDVFLRSRLHELISTLRSAAVGALIFFFVALLNDLLPKRTWNYALWMLLFMLLFVCVYTVRLIRTQYTIKKIHKRQWGLPSLIVGTSENARALRRRIDGLQRGNGLDILGFVAPSATVADGSRELDGLPVFGLDGLDEVCQRLDIKSFIVVPPSDEEPGATVDLLNRLYPLGHTIYITPHLYHLITSRPRMSSLNGVTLVDITQPMMGPAAMSLKRFSDIIVASLGLLIASPVLLATAIAVKLDSKGPVFYRQERIGYRKRRFDIYKFRTMRVDAESSGPALSSPNDPRVTRVGRILRKYRLDELPNLWNVVKGDMSIVGPRPEREYFIKQIVERAPYYSLLHQVRPGLTSWGMVQYGYATDLDGMLERLKYDLLYLENMSFSIDMKILIYTVRTVITGRGM